ncbi:asparaginase [Herbaspirillum sp.]|uniref:asparaginase n=1 Tax=Herbaspirillum sp. TaxID=1890675 RepID=UPI001B15F2E1|nr:asparaginase [Herbaspirillum sp.]MBO9536172.1 asparaginase [Herbaspirillum sp.]
MPNSLPIVAVASLGGTISMTPSSEGGIVPTLDAAQLAQSAPGISGIANLRAESLRQLPSASLSFDDLMAVLAWAEKQVEDGAHGIVLTQGTDTLEESAFFLDLYWRYPQPLVLTGAMRGASAAGADGPANLLAAVQTAVDAQSVGRGVLVVMNDTVHEARWVTKADSLSTGAFSSGDGGVAARLVEGTPAYFHPPGSRPAPIPFPQGVWPKVAIIPASLGDGGELASLAADNGYASIIVAATGAGHVSYDFAERIANLAAHIPVFITTRAASGSTASKTYGYVGAEMDLIRRGAHMGGWLSAIKARLLVVALIAAGVEPGRVGESVSNWCKLRSH